MASEPWTFICALCKKEFRSGWSSDEAMEEANRLYGEDVMASQNSAVICDDCFQEFIVYAREQGWVRE